MTTTTTAAAAAATVVGPITQESCSKSFGGYQKVFSHDSEVLKCRMKFAVYLPPQAEDGKCPLLYYLSGLTCTEQNFIQKAGAQEFASRHGLVVVAPDTSPHMTKEDMQGTGTFWGTNESATSTHIPNSWELESKIAVNIRNVFPVDYATNLAACEKGSGCNIPGEDEKWNVGSGASLYLNATREPWSKHYQMYSYIVSELPGIIEQNFPVLPNRSSIFGHSMGGHGALLCAFLNPGKYKSVSAFAPVCDSVKCTPFQEALTSYVGQDIAEQNKWNAIELAKKYDGPPLNILIDQGTEDEFLDDLHPEEFTKACAESRVSVVLNMRQGYDHGYYFVSTFMEDHFKHHAKFLR